MTQLSAEQIAEIARHVAAFGPAITHFGKQVAPETSRAGIAYVNMISMVRIADALEKIAASASGQLETDSEAAVG